LNRLVLKSPGYAKWAPRKVGGSGGEKKNAPSLAFLRRRAMIEGYVTEVMLNWVISGVGLSPDD